MSTSQAKHDEIALENFWPCDSIKYRSLGEENSPSKCFSFMLGARISLRTVRPKSAIWWRGSKKDGRGGTFTRPFMFIIDVYSIIWIHETTTGAHLCLTSRRWGIQPNAKGSDYNRRNQAQGGYWCCVLENWLKCTFEHNRFILRVIFGGKQSRHHIFPTVYSNTQMHMRYTNR